MRFLCIECDEVMELTDRREPGDGTLAAVFGCPACGREVAMLTNPMETQLVSSMGVRIGGSPVQERPMELVRSSLEGGSERTLESTRPESLTSNPESASVPMKTAPAAAPAWSPEAADRLARVPLFVRQMIERLYSEYARDQGIAEITPQVMDQARSELGLEGM